MLDKTPFPGNRGAGPDQQAPSQVHLSNQSLAQIWQICQREAVFAVQLLMVFSVSFTSVQLTRSWLWPQKSAFEKPAVYSARLFWPANAPLPISGALLTGPAHQGLQAADQGRQPAMNPKRQTAVSAAKQQPAQRLASTVRAGVIQPAVRRMTVPVPTARSQRHFPQAVYSRARRVPSYRETNSRLAAAKKRHDAVMAPLKQILQQEYHVTRLESYSAYLSWARKTLKSYQDG